MMEKRVSIMMRGEARSEATIATLLVMEIMKVV